MNSVDEKARLDELHSIGLLDTDREERFDRYTRLAAKIFDVPIVLISLVDEDRLWIKSSLGCELSQFSRKESICSEALNRGYLEISDAFEDKVFRDHPAVKGDQPIRFYAGAVIYGPTGKPLGTLCLNDRIPRELSVEGRSWLKIIARLVQDEVYRNVVYEKANRKTPDSILSDPTARLPGDAYLKDSLKSQTNMSRHNT